ncbi:MAG: TatD family hydrolase [Ferruginibacter sp.]
MKLIDTHSHLYDEVFSGDIEQVLQKALEEGVSHCYLPAIDSSSHEAMLALENNFPEQCTAMMGLHPCYVKENYKEELAIVEQYLQQRKFVAIGEIGLDYYWDRTFEVQQKEVFQLQMEWAIQYQLPIVIHTRNAMQETIDMVKPFVPKGIRGIFHCFSGSYESAKEIIKAGFYLGIGGVVTYKNAGLAEVLEKISLEHLVLETDAPYLTPVPFRGKRNESSYLSYIVHKMAEIKGVPTSTIASITTANAQKIFGS